MKLLQGCVKLISMAAGTKRGKGRQEQCGSEGGQGPFQNAWAWHGVHHAKLAAISLRSGPHVDRDCLLSARSPACRRCRHSLSDNYNDGWPMTSQKDLLQENPFHVLFFLLSSSLVTRWQELQACQHLEGLLHNLSRKTALVFHLTPWLWGMSLLSHD